MSKFALSIGRTVAQCNFKRVYTNAAGFVAIEGDATIAAGEDQTHVLNTIDTGLGSDTIGGFRVV